MAQRRLKPGWYVLGGGLAVLALWLEAPRLLRHLDFFRVRRVEVVGLRYLSADTVLSGLAVPARLSLFDDLGTLERRAAVLPGTEEVTVGRRWPGTLRIQVREVEPVALVPGSGRLQAVDADGRRLPIDATRGAPDLPVLRSNDSLVTRFLAKVKDIDPELFGQVVSARRMRNEVVLDLGGQRLWFLPDATGEVIRGVVAVARDLERKGRRYEELDGRFAGQVVVRWRGA